MKTPPGGPGSGSEPTDIGEFLRDGSTVDAEPSPRPELAHPQRIGRYRVLEVLGQGGMGTVYLAEQTEPIRAPGRDQADPLFARRLAVHASLRGRAPGARPDEPSVHRPGLRGGRHGGAASRSSPWSTFRANRSPTICDRERLSIDARLDLFVAVCRGIHHAHQKGILHRDIKPPNILVATEQGRPVPKIIDFGVAKALDAEDQRRARDRLRRRARNAFVPLPGVDRRLHRDRERRSGHALRRLRAGRPPLRAPARRTSVRTLGREPPADSAAGHRGPGSAAERALARAGR